MSVRRHSNGSCIWWKCASLHDDIAFTVVAVVIVSSTAAAAVVVVVVVVVLVMVRWTFHEHMLI